jgi:membrane-bound ClpP family serine protease
MQTMLGRDAAVTGGSKFRRPAVEVWTGLALLLAAASGPAAQPEVPEGLFITVPNPITSEAVERIQKQIEARKHGGRGLGVIVFDFNPDGKPAWTARPGVCSDLTHLIRGLRDKVTTVAYVHNKVSGHTVMPVLACDEIIMSRNGALGEITGSGSEPPRTEYEGYFLRGDPRYGEQRFALIKKMYDPQVQLRKASSRKDPNQKVYVDARDPNVDKLYVGLEPVRGVADNAVALYTAEVAREVGLRRGALAESRAEVAEMYGLPAAVVRDDPLGGRDPQVFTYVLRGEVDGAMRESVHRVLRNVRSRGGNVLILELHCGGNDLVAARGLAEDLRAAQSGDQPLQIIAFIPESAPAAGTVVALGCTQIVMTLPTPPGGVGEPLPSATLGDFSRYVESAPPKDIEAHRLSLRELARLQGYPEVLIDGMLDRQVEIVRAVRKDDARQRRLMSRPDLEAQANEWQLDKVIKHPGEWWVLDAALAKDIGVARYTVTGKQVSEVATLFGFRELRPADPGWLDRFAEFLRKPVVTVLLVVIGFTGLILELKVPGLTVPGIVAALCFILVFWSQSRFSGQTFVLALLLFLLGLVLVGTEIFVLPGFGAPGIFGILSMLAGLALVTFDRLPESGAEWGQLGWRVLMYLLAMLGALLSALLIARFLPKVPYANRLILEAPAERGERAVEFLPGAEEAAELLGAIGTSHTPLRPAGVVRFGDKFVDVVSDGSFIPAGTRVQVIQVEGTRIVVKEV